MSQSCGSGLLEHNLTVLSDFLRPNPYWTRRRKRKQMEPAVVINGCVHTVWMQATSKDLRGKFECLRLVWIGPIQWNTTNSAAVGQTCQVDLWNIYLAQTKNSVLFNSLRFPVRTQSAMETKIHVFYSTETNKTKTKNKEVFSF